MRDQHDPIGTLRDEVGRHWIWLHCRCGHAVKHDPADLADRLGQTLPLKDLVRRSRCRACGAGRPTLTIQPPYLKDGSDAPRQRIP